MARRRTVIITEDLAPIERKYRGRPERTRIRALMLLQENPARTHREVAKILGVSKSSIDKWVGVYRHLGLEGLLEPPKLQRASSEAGIQAVLPESQSLIGLMNRLPLTLDSTEAVEVLRNELMAILPDVDRIVISVDMACDLVEPEQYHPDLDVIQDATVRGNTRRRLKVVKRDEQTSPALALLDDFRAQGYPVDDYHPPQVFEIRYGSIAPLGTLFLWRELSGSPISQRTIDLVTTLLPFLGYVLSNIITRHDYANPGDRLFRKAVRLLSKESGLSIQERHVVNYRLHGYSYKAIAETMGLTEDTVKKHLGSVHRKTGTSGHAELFAKYFSPLITPASGTDRE